jgi:uncharacterized membrane protein
MSATFTPAIAIHVAAALGAVATGAVALWARRVRAQRPRLHRAFGYAWVTLMVVTALSALFIRGGQLPNIGGFSPIHLLVPFTLWSLVGAFVALARGQIARHKKIMQGIYFGAGIGAGVFTLLPGRLLGGLLWGDLLGLLPAGYAQDPAAHAQQAGMVAQILSRTPLWVWGLLAGLVVLGLTQVRRREAGLPRVTILPVAMAALSLSGIVSAFGAAPAVLSAWLVAAVLAAALVMRRAVPAGTTFDAGTRRFTLPGSWVPLLLILGIFVTKYAVNVATAMQPGLKLEPLFALGITTLYGIFSGLFAGRTLRLVRLALRPAARPALA